MIPRIIHQTWKTSKIPDSWQGFVQSWKFHHPNWEYKLWTNDDGAAFVKKFYPEFQSTYLGYPYDIQRADAIRYLVVHHYGGLYADLDFECLQSFECMRDTGQLVIGFEPQSHANDQAQQELLCNALFASPAGSPFLASVINHMVSSNEEFKYDVLKTTGPVMLQYVYEQTNTLGVDTLPSFSFCPFVNNAPELLQLAENPESSNVIRQDLRSRGCYAVHHWANSWTRQTLGDLLNPAPASIEGFDFYPGFDSPGMDVFHGGRDIVALSERCQIDPLVVAFNTDGFAKHTVCSRSELTEMIDAKYNEGLYVKRLDTDSMVESRQYIYLPSVGPNPFRLRLDESADQVISPIIRDCGFWERVETELVCKLISQSQTVVDIGAHIGYFTVLFSNLVGRDGLVHGFEPEERNYALLEENVALNKLTNVTIERSAVSNRSKTESLYLSDFNKGDHRLVSVSGREVQEVSCVKLDQYWGDGAQEVHFIKIDTQGHELEVLLGMIQLIQRNEEHLCCLVEFSPKLLLMANLDGVNKFIRFFDLPTTELYWINEQGGSVDLVLMDKAALLDLARLMMDHPDEDHSCNLLVFFTERARAKYFTRLGW